MLFFRSFRIFSKIIKAKLVVAFRATLAYAAVAKMLPNVIFVSIKSLRYIVAAFAFYYVIYNNEVEDKECT